MDKLQLEDVEDTLHVVWKFTDNKCLDDYTLIIPSVAVGNVAQFACDLVISSLNMEKLASVYSAALIPVIGMNPYDMESPFMSSCCEVYSCSRQKLITFQLRAPLVRKHAKGFLDHIVTTFKEKNVSNIIILTSSFAHEKKNIQSSPFRYVASDSSPFKSKAAELNWIEHKAVDNELKIFGGGFAALLYDTCIRHEIPTLILFKYCSEGDNIPDAYDMVVKLTDIKALFTYNQDPRAYLKQPGSWKLLFGGPPPADLY